MTRNSAGKNDGTKLGKNRTSTSLETYVIGFYDMGMFDECEVVAHDEDEAVELFLFSYAKKRGIEPYIARCETLEEAGERIKSGNTALPRDWQLSRFDDISNMYHEALNN